MTSLTFVALPSRKVAIVVVDLGVLCRGRIYDISMSAAT
jgi:hypothetical protein